MPFDRSDCTNEFEGNLTRLQNAHHPRCIFLRHPPVDNLLFSFSKDGALMGKFTCSAKHQGYDGIVHGGVIAAIIDSSMAKCCMGHGIIAYTADLSIRYRNTVRIDIPVLLETKIVERKRDKLFLLECRIMQKGRLRVDARGCFFRVSGGADSR
jgi:acyl-coenzyme A thioesterase PaaI-like protein